MGAEEWMFCERCEGRCNCNRYAFHVFPYGGFGLVEGLVEVGQYFTGRSVMEGDVGESWGLAGMGDVNES